MITVKLVRIISGFVLTEHPHLALMYGGHHPNIDYSYRANLRRRFNGSCWDRIFCKSPDSRIGKFTRANYQGPGSLLTRRREESWWSGGHLGSGMLCHRWQTLTSDMSTPTRPLIGQQPPSAPLIGSQAPVSLVTSDMNDWLFIAV